MFFSKQNNGFYNESIHDSIPEDAVEISAEYHQELVSGQETGKVIYGDDRGYPRLKDRDPPSEQKLKEQNNKRHRAYLNSTDWYVVRKMETGADIPEDVAAARAAARLSIVE